MPCGRRRGARAREAGLRAARLGHGVRAPGRGSDPSALGDGGPAGASPPRHTSPATGTPPTARCEESYRRHIEARRSTLAAVRDTFWLGLLHNTNGEPGRRRRLGGARRPAAGAMPARTPVEHGYLAVHEMFRHIFAGEFAAALEVAERSRRPANGAGTRTSSRWGCRARAGCSSTAGGCREGLALLDEAMVGSDRPATSRRSSPGNVYCSMVEALPGDRRLPADGRVDHAADPLVRGAAGPRAVHRAVRGAPGADHAVARRPARGARRARAGHRAVRRRGRHARGRAGALRAGRGAAGPGRLRRRGGRLRGGARRSGATRSPGWPCSALARGAYRGGRGDGAAAAGRDAETPCTAARHLPAAVEVFLAAGDVDAGTAGGR